MIKKYHVDFTILNAEICIELENYLAVYCRDSLEQLTIVCEPSRCIFKDLPKPLKKVTDLRVEVFRKSKKTQYIRFLHERNLPSVLRLEIFLSVPASAIENSENIHFENVEDFTLIGSKTIVPFSFRSATLKHLTFNFADTSDAFYEFIGRAKNLKTLKIMDTAFVSGSEWFIKILHLQNIQSNVEEIEFEYTKDISPEVILRCLNQTTKLTKLTIHIMRNQNTEILYTRCLDFIETISSNLDSAWKFHTKHVPVGSKHFTNVHIRYMFEKIIKD